MSGIVGDLRSKFENNFMYVINQKSSHFPNNLPNGAMYFPDSQMHPAMHMHGDQLAFPPCMPSMINNHNAMQASMTRFVNPQNANSIRQHSMMNSSMMPHGNKNQKSNINSCSIPDDIGYPTSDHFPSMNAPFKARNPPMDPIQSAANSLSNPNISADLMNSGNVPADLNVPVHVSNGNRVPTPRNKRTRTTASRSHTPNIKESMNSQPVMASCNVNTVMKSTSINGNVVPNATPGIPHQKCLPHPQQNSSIPIPYNMVDMVPQQLRPRVPVNVINSYGCNRSQIMDKNMSMFPPVPQHPSPGFNPPPSPHTVQPFFTQIDNGLPLPMFHLHSKLSKLPDSDRLTFPVNHGNLWGPLTLRHGDQVTEIQFELNQDNLQQIVTRSDLDIVVTSFTHRDQFRLCHWPEFLELRINGNVLSLDSTLLQDLKVHMPCFIKRFCKLGTNVLQFTVSKCVCCHLFQIYMVHRPTLSHAVDTIQSKCISSISTKSILSEIYSRNAVTPTNVDDNNGICVVSLVCPMSQMRITVPARTKCCKHVQPFDLLEFLKVQSKWPQYFCPICRVRVTFNLNEYIQNIIVDEVLKEIISQADHSVKRVILYPDGNWKPVNDVKPPCTAATMPLTFQDPYAYDSSLQVVRQSPVSSRSAITSPPAMMQPKPSLCNDIIVDKRPTQLHPYPDSDFFSVDTKTVISPSKSQSRSNTPLASLGLEPSPQKRCKRSPNDHRFTESFANTSLINFSNLSSELEKPVVQWSESKTALSPESINTPSSSTSVPTGPDLSYHAPSGQEEYTRMNLDTDTNLISSTTGMNSTISTRTSTLSANADNVNKQTSSGSSNPSSPPEFFDPHSATTNYEDDDNSSLHLQRLIGFIDDILSEEEEYVLDTQWASFTWPSADKSLDLLHLSDIEKLL